MTELVENSWVFVEENPWAKAIGIVLLIVSVFGIIYAVRLRNQARMRAEVQNILFEYYPLQVSRRATLYGMGMTTLL